MVTRRTAAARGDRVDDAPRHDAGTAGPATGPDVLTFGETMVALRGSGPLKLGGTMQVSVAGAESNVAIGLARLGHETCTGRAPSATTRRAGWCCVRCGPRASGWAARRRTPPRPPA
ncbi:hypothetical protein GCM10010211_22220 [Streptomyces albospinus]|uniref:Carbohydrate kinase PfkB domain-containing protein n=1 Tax=Streptomyces albospinus TaxID=285515 RepID=A0ABQ2UX13_9ACTN|nr:hypothetical protein GCM10010211_22220 [Streptomyces albospinus]